MRQESHEMSEQSAPTRASEVFEALGQGIGMFAALTHQRIQQVMMTIRAEANITHPMQPATHTPTTGNRANNARVERAEAAVEGMSKHLSEASIRTLFHIQRIGAYLREDVEDLWMEAQYLRQQARHTTKKRDLP